MNNAKELKLIIPILEYYASSYIGIPRPDGTYLMPYMEVSGRNDVQVIYDPRPAREGLRIIKKVLEDEVQ